MIRVRDLRKSFGGHAVLEGASFEVHDGGTTLLIGPNGAGKTTTMRLLAGLARPEAGSIEISGRSQAADGAGYRAMLSFLPQNPAFHPRFTCRQILNFYADLRGVNAARVAEVIRLAGLEDVTGKASGKLSGGMRQRLGLALLLLPGAPVLLLDEPGLSLDPEWRHTLQRIIHDEAAKGCTVLVTTHLLAEWDGQSDRCLLCRDGVIRDGVNPAALAFETTAEFAEKSGAVPRHPPYPTVCADTAGRTSQLRAVLRREIHAALINRYLQVFSILALVGGLSGVWMSENLETIAHFTLQMALFSVPLFAVLLGISSALMESEEWPVLFSQPVQRSLIFGGKFIAGWAVFALLLGLLFVPGIFVGAPPVTTVSLYATSMGLAAVFVALGLCVGVCSGDRVRALISGIVVWLALFLLFDLAVAALAGWPFMQKLPAFWVGLLMANPLDAFRVQALFALEQIPPEAAAKSPLAALWLEHARGWFGVIAALWTAAFLAATMHRVARIEV